MEWHLGGHVVCGRSQACAIVATIAKHRKWWEVGSYETGSCVYQGRD